MKHTEVRMLENEKIGQSAAKPRTAEGPTTNPQGSRAPSDWALEMEHYL